MPPHRLVAPPGKARTNGLLGVLALSVVGLVWIVSPFHPLADWMVWHYLRAAGSAAVLVAACVAVGDHALELGRLGERPFVERIAYAAPLGVVIFYATFTLVGALSLYSSVAFFAVPAAMLAVSGRRALREIGPRVRAAVSSSGGMDRLTVLIVALGCLGVLLVSLPVLSPETVSYDARWYHLALAENDAAAGGILRSTEGFGAAAYPQLATILYTWAFLSPFATPFDRICLAQHVELALFLLTLASLPPLVARLAPDARGARAWPALFLFTGVLVYDSSLVAGADHVAAFFAAPLALALFDAWDDLTDRACALLGVFAGAGIATKYTAAMMVIPVLVVFTLQAAVRRKLRSIVITAGAVVLVTSPWWLRNVLLYGNPMYPMLATWFHPHPWTNASSEFYRAFRDQNFIPGAMPPQSLPELLGMVATFAIRPHDWPIFHGVAPVFGFAFTIATLCLMLLRGVGRTWALAGLAYSAIALWAMLFPQDRYLQVLVPWMTAVTVSAFSRVWQLGVPHRALISAVVLFHAIWGVGAYFLDAHSITRKSPFRMVADALTPLSGPSLDARLHPFAPMSTIARSLPEGAHVLVHEHHLHLGIGRTSVHDYVPWSFGIDWGRSGGDAGVDTWLRAAHVTHVVWQSQSRATDSVAGDLVFLSYVARRLETVADVAPFHVGALRSPLSPEGAPQEVGVVTCTDALGYASGIYSLDDLASPMTESLRPRASATPRRPFRAEEIPALGHLVVERACGMSVIRSELAPFFVVGARLDHDLYARRAP